MLVGLVGCGKKKLSLRAPAHLLYQGSLFRKSYACALKFCDRVLILSALYGVLDPEKKIDPYDLSLRDLSVDEQRAWAKLVRRQLPSSADFVYFCGFVYSRFLPEGQHPLANLSFGRRLQKLNCMLMEKNVTLKVEVDKCVLS